MTSRRTNTSRGIAKRPSTPLYPGDILAEPDLMGATIGTFGFWMKMLLFMMRSDTYFIEDNWAGLARMTGTEIDEAKRHITEICNRKIGHVTVRNEIVRAENRRLKRQCNARNKTRERVRKHRAKHTPTGTVKRSGNIACNGTVTTEKDPPSSSSSSSLSGTKVPRGESPPVTKGWNSEVRKPFLNELKLQLDAVTEQATEISARWGFRYQEAREKHPTAYKEYQGLIQKRTQLRDQIAQGG